MKLSFFSIPALHAESAQEALNSFLSSHRVVSLEKQFVADGASSFWSICVSYLEGSAPVGASGRRDRVDYRQVLSESDFVVYAELRALRKSIAERRAAGLRALHQRAAGRNSDAAGRVDRCNG